MYTYLKLIILMALDKFFSVQVWFVSILHQLYIVQEYPGLLDTTGKTVC